MGKKERVDRREKELLKQREKLNAEEKMAEMQLFYATQESLHEKQKNVILNYEISEEEQLAILQQEQLAILQQLSLSNNVVPGDKFSEFAAAVRRQNTSSRIPEMSKEEDVEEEFVVVPDESDNDEDEYNDDEVEEEKYISSPSEFKVPKEFTLDETVQQLMKQIDALNERIETITLCDLCMERSKTVAIVPCGHLTCKKCADGNTCPFCSGTVVSHMVVYL